MPVGTSLSGMQICLVNKIYRRLNVSDVYVLFSLIQFWSLLARDGSIWQDVDLFDFQKDIQVSIGFEVPIHAKVFTM